MVEPLKRLTLLSKEREGEQLDEGHPFCAKIKSKTWEREYIDFNKYDCSSDPRMHITIFEEAISNHQNDTDMLERLFQLSLGEEAFEWFYSLENQSIKSYEQLKQNFLTQYQHNIKRKPTLINLERMRQDENQSFDEFVTTWKKVATLINLSEKVLKHMLIKSLRDEMVLEFFNYLE